MKSNLEKARVKAPKKSSCALCKPHKRGGGDKKTARDVKLSGKHADELKEAGA